MQHVPFESRNREVVYILEPPKRRSNGFGVAGFVLSILGFFTCFTLSPIALLFSFLGMFKAPRGLATAGLVLSVIGTTAIAGIAMVSIREEHSEHHAVHTAYARNATEKSLQKAKRSIESWRLEHDGVTPEGIEGNKMVLSIEDGWRTSLSYEPDDNGYTLRSAGPDRDFDTRDDLTSRVALTAKEKLSLELQRDGGTGSLIHDSMGEGDESETSASAAHHDRH